MINNGLAERQESRIQKDLNSWFLKIQHVDVAGFVRSTCSRFSEAR